MHLEIGFQGIEFEKWIGLPLLPVSASALFWFATTSCAQVPGGIEAANRLIADVPGALTVIEVGVERMVAMFFGMRRQPPGSA